ncbi:GMP synthase (glutamine-hydrolysing) [Poseidonocella pacifica]|uniref:GMP synthase (Glutamine-hydrolysing) n=1 Tax=Poseidonocella pacifica TaxID=871651 RepID=A0A1I0X2T5_9RHOB|nr:type 1 glutamine amidotransferase [Poseidonocella pacifica]SFA94977.1 GMP synthase (glutamine-hydrolysing) [Poseidonocella pacifica]
MKIGILQTGHFPDALQPDNGDYDAMFRRLLGGRGYDFETWNIVDGDFPGGPEDADAWLITGSRHGAYEDHPWIPPLEELIRQIRTAGRPLVGVCFGHQIIAQALGGRVEKFSGGWSVGPQSYELEGETTTLNAWHQDQVTQLPPDAKVVGSSDFCANAALLYGDRIYTVQPHPEFTATMIDGLMRERAPGVVPEPLLVSARARLDAPTDSERLAARFAEIFSKGAKT